MKRFALLTFLIPMATVAANGGSPVAVGNLVCSGGEGIGLVLGSKKTYECVFEQLNGAKAPYTASITKIGLDIGVTGKSTMVWTVMAASPPKGAHDLAGSYIGADADASFGLGGGVKVLVGGTGQSFALQPVSVQGQTGLNLAVGVAELTLK